MAAKLIIIIQVLPHLSCYSFNIRSTAFKSAYGAIDAPFLKILRSV